QQLAVRGLFFSERIESRDLDAHLGMAREPGEPADVLIAYLAVHPDASEMIDDDRRFGIPRTHPVDLLEMARVDQTANRLTRLRRTAPHPSHAGCFEPLVGAVNEGRDAKSRNL